MSGSKHNIIQQLQREILPLQGYKLPLQGTDVSIGLGPLERAFPHGRWPTGAIHEFIATGSPAAAATAGFTAAVVGRLMQHTGVAIWIGKKLPVFPGALDAFGIGAERVIFITPDRDQHVAWAMEEALKCEGLAAVVGHIRDIDAIASRRLQLAVEQSGVTGFLLRHDPRQISAIAAVARWQITPLASGGEAGMPGVGSPRWEVALLKVRNGQPGKWKIEWSAGAFHILPIEARRTWPEEKRKAV